MAGRREFFRVINERRVAALGLDEFLELFEGRAVGQVALHGLLGRERRARDAGEAHDFHAELQLRVDRAHHENPLTPLQRTQVASYGGALQQALRDLAAWVETGTRPSETRYRVVDTQVIVPGTAAERGGVQPVVELMANWPPCAVPAAL